MRVGSNSLNPRPILDCRPYPREGRLKPATGNTLGFRVRVWGLGFKAQELQPFALDPSVT